MENFQSGQYINQGYYKSFQPNFIDREWKVLDMSILQLLSKADRHLGRLDMYSQYVNIELFIKMHIAKEATQSSKIEGTQTNIEELGERLSSRFADFCKEYGRDLILAFEPGKFLVSEAGYFLVKVNVVKQTTSTVFAGIDSGFNHLIRPMFYGANHYIENISNPEGKKRFYSVVGYICETDTFASNRQIAEITEGDILCFHNAGAYCYTMASNYNSRLRPAEVLWQNGEAKLIRKAETLEDLLRGQIY